MAGLFGNFDNFRVHYAHIEVPGANWKLGKALEMQSRICPDYDVWSDTGGF